MKYLDILEGFNFWGGLKKAPGKSRAQYVDRLVEQAQNDNISAVVGVRRSGKSTILKQVIDHLVRNESVRSENTLIVNLEDPRLTPLLSDNKLFELVEAFKAQADLRSRLYLVLDEIQNVPSWESIIRTLHDQEPRLKIYLAGSSAQLLGKELGTKLAGRHIKTEVFPLSYTEYRLFTQKKVQRYVQEGGFPDPILTESAEQREQLLKDYYESILLRDITIRYGIRDEFKLRRLSAQLFASVANQASSYRLSKDLELSADTVLQYFNYIEDAYLGFFVPQFALSVRKQNYNPKKFYSIDNGLQSAVAFRVLDDAGKLFKNAVFLALRRSFNQIFYWQEEKEVDFVVKEKEQIKYVVNAAVSIVDQHAYEREVASLMAGMHQLKIDESYLVLLEGKRDIIQTEVGTVQIMLYPEFEKMVEK